MSCTFILLGSCTCGPGFTGPLCDQQCDHNSFGPSCEQICQCDENNSIGCDPISGKCICKPEWKGNVLSLFL